MTRGQYMREARLRAGLTLRQLEERSGVAYGTICQLELDQRDGNITTIELLADALGLSLDEYTGHARRRQENETQAINWKEEPK